jgi:ATP-dependent protease ClpP protease subunit
LPSWGEILGQVATSALERGGEADYDGIRRGYVNALSGRTSRDTIIYYTDWLGRSSPATSITLEDMQGMMEVSRGLKGPALDIVLHSPGGYAEATASIVRYLRKRFQEIRVFVPLAAMSAATMWALSANRIVMGKHSQLGPIDPQFPTGQGQQASARALIESFERAKREISEDASVLGAWLPILQQFGPALLEQCEAAEALAKKLVEEWLGAYMFAGDEGAAKKAADVAEYFADYRLHPSHGMGIDREQARDVGVVVDNLEEDQDLQDAVLSVHHATLVTMSGRSPVKIIENQLERAFVQHQPVMSFQMQPQLIPTPPEG